MRRPALLLLLLVSAIAACADDDTAFTSTTAPATSTAAAPTTTAPTTTTSTAAPTTTAPTTTAVTTITTLVYVIDPAQFMPDVFGAPGDPRGSGCVVEGDVLPDGVWFGFAEAVTGGVITFDLACYFDGAAAEAAAIADGTEALDEYIRNKNPKVFSVPIAAEAEVFYVDAAGPDWFPEPLPLASWPSATSWLPCPSEDCAVWLFLNGGAATGIVEQYLP